MFKSAAQLLSSFLLSLVVMANVATPAFAQEVTAPINPEQEMNQLRTTYRSQLETYRAAERQYTISKEQYAQLQTLGSLEEAVQSTKKAMEARLDLFETYFQMLKITLLSTTGIDVQTKTAQVEAIDAAIVEIKQHRLAVERAQDRPQLLGVQQQFIVLTPQIEEAAYKTLMVISYGRVQAMLDKTTAVSKELADYVDTNEKNALKIAEKRRGFEEIGRTLTLVNQELTNTNRAMNQPKERYSASDYSYVVSLLEKAYGGLSRTITYLEEILK